MRKQFSLIAVAILAISLFFIQNLPSISSVACSCTGIDSGDGNPPQSCGPSVANCGSGEQFFNQCGGINPDYTCGGECYCALIAGTCFSTESACRATLSPVGCAALGRSNLNWCFLYSANCWKTTVKGCQFGACPADVCSGVVAWSNYPFTASSSCSGVGDGSENGLCSTSPTDNGLCNPVQSTCSLSKQCIQEGCGGAFTTCHYSNSGTWLWDSTLSGESACTDGFDNDCDLKIDCVIGNEDPDCGCLGNPTAPKLKFKDASGNNIAIIGNNGIMDIRGTLSQNQASISPTAGSDFIVRTVGGTIVALLDNSGNLKLKGLVIPSQTNLNTYLSNAQTEFIVKNSTTVLAVIDQSGNLKLLGGVRQSQANPQ